MLLAQKTALITGANRGIGRAIAQVFASEGAQVIAAARSVDDAFVRACSELAHTHGVTVTPLALDLGSEDSIKSALRTLAGQVSSTPVDVLVNCAGVASGALVPMTSLAEMRRLFEVNFFGPLQFSQGVARLMARRKSGSLIFLSSLAAQRANPGTLAYGCSKAALERAVQSFATELGSAGIRVNAIAPNVTLTDMAEQMDPAARERLVAAAALQRAAAPDEIARVALFLASDLSSYITGQTLRADGGVL